MQVLHPFIKRDPQNSDEEEHIENLFNALCSCLMSDETRRAFVEAEGVELMVLMLKARRFARAGALKALDFALTRSPAACEHFVETLGLKPFCAMFMGRTKVKLLPTTIIPTKHNTSCLPFLLLPSCHAVLSC